MEEIPAQEPVVPPANSSTVQFPQQTVADNGVHVYQMQSAQISLSDSIAAMVTIDGMQNPEIQQRFMKLIEERELHNRELDKCRQDRADARADRALEEEIRISNKVITHVFILFLLLVLGFLSAVFLGVSAPILYAFGVFFVASGIAVFARLRYQQRKPDR